MKERVVNVAGEELRVRESGPSDHDRPMVVLLPGAGDTAHSWSAVRDGLGEGVRVLSYDRRGMGKSSGSPTSVLAVYVEELHGVLEAMAPYARYVLVGHSFGGLLARGYAQSHPERVAALVLVDATPPAAAQDRGVRGGFLISAALAGLLRFLAPVGVIRGLIALQALPVYPEQRAFRAMVSPEAYAKWTEAVHANLAGNARHEIAAVLPVAAALDTTATRSSAGVPTALVYSRAYGARWELMQQDVAAELGAASVHATHGRSHNIHMSQPDVVSAAVRELLPPEDPDGLG